MRTNNHTQTIFAVIFLLLLLSGCSADEDQALPEAEIIREKGIPYIAGDTSVRHTLDVYHLSTAVASKVVMFVPGGAWRQGDKNMYETLARTLCGKAGFTVVVINYRLSDSLQGSALHPDHINDVAAAFGWVEANIGRYGGDRNALFLFGQSAGAHLVSLLVTDTHYLESHGCGVSMIRGVISMSAPYTLSNLVTLPVNPWGLTPADVMMYRVMIQDAFGGWDTTVVNQASPSRFLHGEMPPMMIIHTELDMPGFEKEGDDFHGKILAMGHVPVSLHHMHQSDYSAETWAAATAMAAAEPAVSAYIGHYAEVVAINEFDYEKAPAAWIIAFIQQY